MAKHNGPWNTTNIAAYNHRLIWYCGALVISGLTLVAFALSGELSDRQLADEVQGHGRRADIMPSKMLILADDDDPLKRGRVSIIQSPMNKLCNSCQTHVSPERKIRSITACCTEDSSRHGVRFNPRPVLAFWISGYCRSLRLSVCPSVFVSAYQ